ncbi:Alkaline phosphatase superfamily phosphoglycerol transferase-related protein, partial [Pseudomonas amygdali pv. myricae]
LCLLAMSRGMTMSWLQSRRLHYWLSAVILVFLLSALLRGVFFFGFSGVEPGALFTHGEVAQTLGIGVRFDLRLALLILLPVAVLLWLPRWNMVSQPVLRWLARGYLIVALAVLTMIHIVDFGHYAYLGVRLNASVMRYLEDAQISRDMLWQTYPVLWITAGWLLTVAALGLALLRLERVTLDRQARPLNRWSVVWGSALVVCATFLGLLGRVENLNLENPVPLRWSDAFFSGNSQVAALGLNPALFLYDTLKVSQSHFDEAQVREHYESVARYLGVQQPDAQALNFKRHQPVQPYRVRSERPPNVMFVMLESLGTSAVGAYG